MFIETSAKAGHNVKTLFRKIAQALPGMEREGETSAAANQSPSCLVVCLSMAELTESSFGDGSDRRERDADQHHPGREWRVRVLSSDAAGAGKRGTGGRLYLFLCLVCAHCYTFKDLVLEPPSLKKHECCARAGRPTWLDVAAAAALATPRPPPCRGSQRRRPRCRTRRARVARASIRRRRPRRSRRARRSDRKSVV